MKTLLLCGAFALSFVSCTFAETPPFRLTLNDEGNAEAEIFFPQTPALAEMVEDILKSGHRLQVTQKIDMHEKGFLGENVALGGQVYHVSYDALDQTYRFETRVTVFRETKQFAEVLTHIFNPQHVKVIPQKSWETAREYVFNATLTLSDRDPEWTWLDWVSLRMLWSDEEVSIRGRYRAR